MRSSGGLEGWYDGLKEGVPVKLGDGGGVGTRGLVHRRRISHHWDGETWYWDVQVRRCSGKWWSDKAEAFRWRTVPS